MKPMGIQPVEILLIDDNPADVLITKEALDGSAIVSNLHTAPDGVEAMAFLRKEGKHKDAPRPGLILLDLNLARKDGREVLAEIKSDEKLRRIPVVVLTASKSAEDIRNAYGLHANCYVVKPENFEKFAEVVRHIEHFWFAVVKLPTKV